jgi:uncharacterized protein (TIGR03000 family)
LPAVVSEASDGIPTAQPPAKTPELAVAEDFNMRLAGIKAMVCASLVALAAAAPASAWWHGGWGYGYGWPYYGYWGGYYGYSPWYWGDYYAYSPYSYNYYPYYSYYPYSYGYPATYAYTPTYVAPQTVVAAPTTSTYQSFYSPATSLTTLSSPNSAFVRVLTAPNAQIWFDGVAMNQTGAVRTFETPELQPGQKYRYDVKVRYVDNGVPVERERSISVSPGQTATADLTPAALR